MKQSDISISGSLGFYTIQPITDAGKDWLLENVPSIWDAVTPWQGVYCDDSRMTEDIAEGAHNDALEVSVNNRLYAGNGRVWVDPFIYEPPCYTKAGRLKQFR